MSSNQNKNTGKNRVSSIRHRLNRKVIHNKIAVAFGVNIIAAALLVCAWLAGQEYALSGKAFTREHKYILSAYNADEFEDEGAKKIEDARKDKVESGIKDDVLVMMKNGYTKLSCLRYTVFEASSGRVIFQELFAYDIVAALAFIFGMHIIQAVLFLLQMPAINGRNRVILKPLTEIAEKADEIAKLDFTEDKYHLIEEKIADLDDDSQKLNLGDDDLKGIENAMNNLLLRIRESNRQQARFVNDASHELRTPIAVIEGYANMLARWGREDEKVLDESITAIQNESANMKHLVEQLLFLARGDAGRTAINMERVSLNGIMQEVYEESLMIDENHIYKLSTPTDDVFVNADEGLLKQAVRILVDNAAKYTNEKDEISLSVGYGDNNTVYLQVQDSGIGMKEADVEHMFERFYRADEARTFNGTGLGLSIAKWIVDKHHGHFEIVSREELGTRIGIYLPKE